MPLSGSSPIVSVKNLSGQLLRGALGLLFPPVCKSCGTRLGRAGDLVCQNCWSNLQPVSDEILSTKAIPENLDAIYAVYLFDERMQRIVHALKYRDFRSMGVKLGIAMGERFMGLSPKMSKAALVPVPLHPKKYRERGYNQSEWLASGVQSVLSLPVLPRLLQRIKNTQSQTKLNARERQDNVRDAFRVSESYQRDLFESVILVDDVFTTGATMNSAAAVCKAAGIYTVVGLTAAMPI